MHLVIVKHAGLVLEVVAAEDLETWRATEGAQWRQRYSSATFNFINLSSGQAEEPKKRGGAK